MKLLQKRSVAAVIMVAAILAGILLGQARKPDDLGAPSTAIVGTYTYTYDHAGVLTDRTMEYIDAMNASLFAQTGAQIMVQTVDTTGGVDIVDYATKLGNQYGVGSAERNNGLVIVLAIEDIAQNGLVGDYGVSGGDGLYRISTWRRISPRAIMTPVYAGRSVPIWTGSAISMMSPSRKTTSPR